MGTNDRLKLAVSWLGELRQLTRDGKDRVTKEQLAAYAKIIAEDFNPLCLTTASARWVAEQYEFFPAWKPLRAALVQWSIDNPRTAKPAGQLSPDAQEWFDELAGNDAHRQREADRDQRIRASWADPGNVRASAQLLDDHPRRLIMGRMLAGLVGRHAPQNLAFLPPGWQRKETPDAVQQLRFHSEVGGDLS